VASSSAATSARITNESATMSGPKVDDDNELGGKVIEEAAEEAVTAAVKSAKVAVEEAEAAAVEDIYDEEGDEEAHEEAYEEIKDEGADVYAQWFEDGSETFKRARFGPRQAAAALAKTGWPLLRSVGQVVGSAAWGAAQGASRAARRSDLKILRVGVSAAATAAAAAAAKQTQPCRDCKAHTQPHAPTRAPQCINRYFACLQIVLEPSSPFFLDAPAFISGPARRRRRL
jgi:hypothetical protein